MNNKSDLSTMIGVLLLLWRYRFQLLMVHTIQLTEYFKAREVILHQPNQIIFHNFFFICFAFVLCGIFNDQRSVAWKKRRRRKKIKNNFVSINVLRFFSSV